MSSLVETASSVLALLDRHTPNSHKLQRIGLTPDRVRELTRLAAPRVEAKITPQEARIALGRTYGKRNHGSAPLPRYVIDAMAADYARLGSLRLVGELYDREPTTVAFIFKRHGVPVKRRGGPNRRTAPAQLAAMVAAYRRLGSLQKVGAMFGRHSTTVRKIFHNHGVPVKGPGGPRKHLLRLA